MKEFEILKEKILQAKDYLEVQEEINIKSRDELVQFLHYHDRHGEHTDELRQLRGLNPYLKPTAALICYHLIKRQSYEQR